MTRFVHGRFALHPVALVTVGVLMFVAFLMVGQTMPAAAQGSASAGAGVRPGVTGTGSDTLAVATRSDTLTVATATRAPTVPATTAPTVAPTATRAPTVVPTRMPPTGGGGMATRYVDEGAGPSRGLGIGLVGLVGAAGVGLLYARRLRRS